MHIETADITANHSINPELDSCKYIYIPPANQKRHRCACPDDLQPIDGEPWCRSRDFKILFIGTRSNLGQGRMEVSTFDPDNNQGNWDRGQGRPKEFETDAEQTLWSLDYHYSHQLMFYFDVRNGKRSLLSRRNSDGAITVLVDVGVDHATKLTVDWLGDSIYFINRDANVFGHNSNPRIEQVSLEGRERRTVIRETELGSPSDLKVDPKEGFIFWVDWDYKIEGKTKSSYVNRCMARATMAGDDVTPIVTSDSVGERISTFTLDYRKKKIYFIDYDTVRVSQIFDSEDPRFESD